MATKCPFNYVKKTLNWQICMYFQEFTDCECFAKCTGFVHEDDTKMTPILSYMAKQQDILDKSKAQPEKKYADFTIGQRVTNLERVCLPSTPEENAYQVQEYLSNLTLMIQDVKNSLNDISAMIFRLQKRMYKMENEVKQGTPEEEVITEDA